MATLNVGRNDLFSKITNRIDKTLLELISLSLYKQFDRIKRNLKILHYLAVLIHSEHLDNNG